MNELEIIRHERIPGLTAFFNAVDYRTPHFHPEWELMWLLDHPLTVSRGGGSFRAEKGSLLLFQPNEPHELHMIDEKCTFLCLQVSPELLRLDSDLVVEDILDSGMTLSFLLKNLSARKPNSIRLCTLLDKPERRKVDIFPDYVGAVVPDKFIVGYGLDYAEKYRNLPYIGVLKPEIYTV